MGSLPCDYRLKRSHGDPIQIIFHVWGTIFRVFDPEMTMLLVVDGPQALFFFPEKLDFLEKTSS